jgi:hypothetical protein
MTPKTLRYHKYLQQITGYNINIKNPIALLHQQWADWERI